MVFYDNLMNPEDENLTDKMRRQREQIKKNLENTLISQGFSSIEVGKVLNVIEIAERDIQVIKDSLIGTNINNEDSDPMQVVEDGRLKIREREIKMGEEIKSVVAQIKKEKGLG